MGAGSVKRRRAERKAEKKSRDYITEVRRAAVKSRKDRQPVKVVTEIRVNKPKDTTPSDVTFWRLKCTLKQLLPESDQSKCEVLAKLVCAGHCARLSVVTQGRPSNSTPSSTFYRSFTSTGEFLNKVKAKYPTLPSDLLLNLAQNLISCDRHLFASVNLAFLNPTDIPTQVLAQLQCDALRQDIMCNMRYKVVRDLTTTLAIRVVKEVAVWKEHEHGEVAGLAKAVGISWDLQLKLLKL